MSRLTSPKYVLRVVKTTEYSEVSAENRARGFWLTYAEYGAGGGGISTRRVGRG
jgi:hypothetical protein